MKRNIILSAAALAVMVGATHMTTAQQVQAADQEGRSSVVSQLVEKFGLNESELQEFFEQRKEERREKKAEHKAEKLAEAVSTNVITQAQADALAAYHQERHEAQDREAWKELSKEDRQAQKESRKSEFEAWAQEQGIDAEALKEAMHPEGERKNKRGRGGKRSH